LASNAQRSGIEALLARLHIVGGSRKTTPETPHIEFIVISE
jgi:hypothetical protein